MAAHKSSEKRQELLRIISSNLYALRMKKFPGRGGQKKCADLLQMRQQQWAPWEKGQRMPNEESLERIAEMFEVSVEYLKTDHSSPSKAEPLASALRNTSGDGGKPDSLIDTLAENMAQSVAEATKRKLVSAIGTDKIKAVFKLELSLVDLEFGS